MRRPGAAFLVSLDRDALRVTSVIDGGSAITILQPRNPNTEPRNEPRRQPAPRSRRKAALATSAIGRRNPRLCRIELTKGFLNVAWHLW
jgi:hypothetical protein